MTGVTLAHSYLVKARKRLKALAVLRAEDAFSDVVREAQEVVELALKGLLRFTGIEPPKIHDVGALLRDHQERFPATIVLHLDRLIEISHWLRKEREFAFYGDIDFIPTEEYGAAQADRALADAIFVVEAVEPVVAPPS